MSSGFRINPQFIPKVETAAVRGLDDAAQDMVDSGGQNIQPYSSSAARAVNKTRAAMGPNGPTVTVKIGRGLGPIFEWSKQQPRRTRQGADRGVMLRRPFFTRAIQDVIRRGINLSRYL